MALKPFVQMRLETIALPLSLAGPTALRFGWGAADQPNLMVKRRPAGRSVSCRRKVGLPSSLLAPAIDRRYI
jgi:hypothetical protein